MLGSSSWLRTSPFHGEGHGFESRTEYEIVVLSNWLARLTVNQVLRAWRFESVHHNKNTTKIGLKAPVITTPKDSTSARLTTDEVRRE